jgi:hypothetical protein
MAIILQRIHLLTVVVCGFPESVGDPVTIETANCAY